jgi:hypothetical protein
VVGWISSSSAAISDCSTSFSSGSLIFSPNLPLSLQLGLAPVTLLRMGSRMPFRLGYHPCRNGLASFHCSAKPVFPTGRLVSSHDSCPPDPDLLP